MKGADRPRAWRFVQSHFPLEIETRRINNPLREAISR